MDLPNSTIVNRFIPKEKFYGKTRINTKLRQLFTDEVEKIIWANKISPQTLNISADEYLEMQVFELWLKKEELNPLVLKHIDTFIPYPIIFTLIKPEVTKLVMSYKEPLSNKNNLMKIDAYFETNWKSKNSLELKGRSVDEIYKNYLHQIAPHLNLEARSDVKSSIEMNQLREKTIKQIDALNRAILHEPSIAKQQELARQRFTLEQQL